MTTCWNSVRGRRMRVTRLDACGIPIPGDCSQVVTDGFISVEFSPEIAEGEEIEVRKADGTLCISDQGCPELKWINIEAQFCAVDPDLFSLMTGYETVLDYAGEAVGNRISSEVQCDEGFALELWSDVPGQACGETGAKPWGYFLLPWLVSGIIGDFTIENDGTTFTFTARTKVGSGWGVGPYDVDPVDAANTPGPLLTPIGPTDHLDLHLTTVAPPEAVCGCQPLTVDES
ncbi:hypothetical protein SAMN05443665_101722 [Actinomadura meyerae]|uniref:Uncharacterized protein n=1 Tax=Actinomadura meyerae TaxID=240840 RepID=A0A239K6X8_9ACTN|nr:hypothetical protein [Actinomadura meyerae]SNT13761.1 hypothetical protein SAMN05443665_101722 [Actinomadura meyerae]